VKVIAIDPWDCGCNECMAGEYVPLHLATDEQIGDLLAGRLRNYMGRDISFEVVMVYVPGTSRFVSGLGEVKVRYENWDGHVKTWSVDPYRAGLAA